MKEWEQLRVRSVIGIIDIQDYGITLIVEKSKQFPQDQTFSTYSISIHKQDKLSGVAQEHYEWLSEIIDGEALDKKEMIDVIFSFIDETAHYAEVRPYVKAITNYSRATGNYITILTGNRKLLMKLLLELENHRGTH